MNKKILSVLLALCMIFSLVVPAFAVTYPEGVTEQNAAETAKGIDEMLESMLKSERKTLSSVVYSMLYSDETLNSILKSIYSSAGDMGAMSAFGVDLSKENVAACLSEYPSVSRAVTASSDLANLNLDGAKWYVRSKDGLAKAIANMIEPLNDLLYFLLCSGSIKISVLPLPGDEGYKNGIVPMLEGFTCPRIMDAETFDAQAAENKNTMVQNMALMVFDLLDEILNAPVEELCKKMPYIADFFNNGGFAAAMDGLLKPISIHVGDIITLVPATQMLSLILMAQDSEKFSSDFTANMTTILNEGLESSEMKLAEINLEEIAACKDKPGDSFVVIMSWLIDTIKLNKDKLPEMMKDSGVDLGENKDILDKLLSKETGSLLALIVKLFTATEGTDLDYQWETKQFTPASVTYTKNLGEREFGRVVDGIDDLLEEAIAEGGEYTSLKKMVKDTVYSNEIVSTLVVGLFGALSTQDMGDAMDMLGMNFSPSGIAQYLTEYKFSKAKYTLRNAKSWDSLKETTIDFGIKKGNSGDFKDALVAVLRPFEPVFRMLLASDTIEIMGSLKIGGSNGYNTAVIPLLEALGCKSNDILTYDQYKKQADGDGCIEAIINPIIKLIDRAAKKPVYTVLEIAPNLLKFIADGNLTQALTNLLYPVQNLLDEIGLTYADLGIEIDKLKETDILKTVSEKLPEMIPDIKMTAPDLSKIASLGTVELRTSKATYQGQNYTYNYVVANKPAVMYTALNFIIGLLVMPENADVINNLMAGGNEDAGMFSQYSGEIGNSMSEMSTEECIEWLYRLFFHERIVEETTVNDYHPDIKYVKEDKFEINYGALALAVFLLAVGGILAYTNRHQIDETFHRIKRKKKDNQEVK